MRTAWLAGVLCLCVLLLVTSGRRGLETEDAGLAGRGPAPAAAPAPPVSAGLRDGPTGSPRLPSSPSPERAPQTSLLAMGDAALADALRRSDDDALRRTLLAELAWRRSGETLGAALLLLDDRAAQSRALAADSLADLGDPSAIEPLRRALSDESDEEAHHSLVIALVRLDPSFEAEGRWQQIRDDLAALEAARSAADDLQWLLFGTLATPAEPAAGAAY